LTGEPFQLGAAPCPAQKPAIVVAVSQKFDQFAAIRDHWEFQKQL